MQWDVWDNLGSSHVTGFQMDVRKRRTRGEVLGSLLQASLLLIGVKMCFKFGGLKALRTSLWGTWEQQCTDIHKAHTAFWEARTCSRSCAVPMSACLSLQVRRARLPGKLWSKLFSGGYCCVLLFVALACPSLLVLQGTRQEGLSHFRSRWLPWE